MEKTIKHKIILGIFVITGIFFFIIALYFIGNKRNMFGDTFRIVAIFTNVNGLQAGNNVRYAGINVGTVENVEIRNDSSVEVVMIIEEKAHGNIKRNAIASIGTDGLMGNKVVNINSMPDAKESVQPYDTLATLKPIETDAMLRTLDKTNDNIKFITNDLKNITKNINSGRGTIWTLLTDTAVAENLRATTNNIKQSSEKTASITTELSGIVHKVDTKNNALGILLTDSAFAQNLKHSANNINTTVNKLSTITGDLSSVVHKVDEGQGVIGTILTDSTFNKNLKESMENIKNGTAGFNENMEALKHNFFLRRYFKKRAQKKQASQNK